jgi:hypothetical protein
VSPEAEFVIEVTGLQTNCMTIGCISFLAVQFFCTLRFNFPNHADFSHLKSVRGLKNQVLRVDFLLANPLPAQPIIVCTSGQSWARSKGIWSPGILKDMKPRRWSQKFPEGRPERGWLESKKDCRH